ASSLRSSSSSIFFFQAEDGIRDATVTGVQTCALPIFRLTLGEHFESAAKHEVAIPENELPLVKRILLVQRREEAARIQRMQGYKIGRASCRERVEVSGGEVAVEEKERSEAVQGGSTNR